MCDCDFCVVVWAFACYACDVKCVVCVWLCLFSMPHCVCCVYSEMGFMCVVSNYEL